MATFNYTLWQEVSAQLQNFKYPKRYLTPENYIAKNPLENLVVPPDIADFFGTKVLNIFIVGEPYGWTKGNPWTESWPPAGLDDAIARHIEMYEQFTWYETHIYMDYNLVNMIMKADPTSQFKSMMDSVTDHLTDVCDQLEDYGFTMEANITSAVDASFFQPVIDAFLLATGPQPPPST